MQCDELVDVQRMRAGRILIPFRAVLFFALFAAATAAYADPNATPTREESACPAGSGEKTAALIQSRYEGIRDIHANFDQSNLSATFAGQPLMTPEPKHGSVVFAKPGKMRWTYLAPEPSVVVSDGQILWIYDIAAESITRFAVTAGFLSGAALQFLLGDGQILESFDVQASACEENRISLDLIPKAEATYVRLGLVADRNSGDVVATSVVDLFGNVTKIGFREIEINLDPPAKTFELKIPDGVEVIDYAGAPGT